MDGRSNSFSLSSWGRSSSPFIIFAAFIGAVSSLLLSFLKCSNQNWTQQLRYNLTNPEWNDHTSITASNAPVAAAQHPVWLCCCSHALLTHVQLLLFTRTLQQGSSPATQILTCAGLFSNFKSLLPFPFMAAEISGNGWYKKKTCTTQNLCLLKCSLCQGLQERTTYGLRAFH